MKITNNHQGQSLVEVIVALGLISLVLVALISAITFSLASVQLSRNKTQSSKLGQEAIEWVRQQRDILGWATFSNAAHLGTFCLNNQPPTWDTGTCGFTLKGQYKRELITAIDGSDVNSINVTVTLTWQQGNMSQTSTLNTKVTNWYVMSVIPSPSSSCGGYYSNGYCWYLGSTGASCDSVCTAHNGCVTDNWNDTTCEVQSHFTTCSYCDPMSLNFAPYVSVLAGHCVNRITVNQDCGAISAGAARLCACNN